MLFRSTGCDWMIVGLGNPGADYENTRHNVGFRAIDLVAEALGTKINRLKFRALVSPVVSCGGAKVLLVKPQTYMNASGDAVKLAGAFYKLPPERIVVLSDDISLPVGKIRVRSEGSAGGHNGLKSIIAQLGTQEFPRVKIGVGQKPNPEYDLAAWVLGTIPAGEQAALKTALKNAAAAAEDIVSRGPAHAANEYNGR